jgi:hypothetical protein
MELDCTLFENTSVYFHKVITDVNYPIEIQVEYPSKELEAFFVNKYGAIYDKPMAKCVIFPKGKTTWEGFVPPTKFKDGDIVATNDSDFIGITTGVEDDEYLQVYCVINYNNKLTIYTDKKDSWLFDRLATEEEKEKLFNKIQEHGYRWNVETKTLEKLVETKFKVGDKIRCERNHSYIYTITGIREEENKYECGVTFVLKFSEQDNWELVPEKFDISTLVPFETKVLVRDHNHLVWIPAIYGYYVNNSITDYPYCIVGGGCYRYLIPYENNEHLLGTKKDCDDFYKTWK